MRMHIGKRFGGFHYQRELLTTDAINNGAMPTITLNKTNAGAQGSEASRRPRSGALQKYSVYRPKKNLVSGSNTLTNGGGAENRTRVRRCSITKILHA